MASIFELNLFFFFLADGKETERESHRCCDKNHDSTGGLPKFYYLANIQIPTTNNKE